MWHRILRHWQSYLIVCLMVAWLMVILFSWVTSAAGYEVNSLLGNDGLRWWFAHAITAREGIGLAYLLTLMCAVGTLQNVGWGRSLGTWIRSSATRKVLSARRRRGLLFSLALLCLWLLMLLLFVTMPHALLLNAMGDFYPSPFIGGLFVAVCFALISVGLAYGSLSGILRTWDDVLHALTHGFRRYAWFVVAYLLFAQVWAAVGYALGGE